MRFMLITLTAVLFLLAGVSLALGEETAIKAELPLPPGTLNAEEVLTLFNNKTVDSVTAVQQRRSVSYFAPNGEVRQIRNGIKRYGHWRVTDSGRICLQMEELPEKCRIIVKEEGNYKKYIVRKNGEHQHSVTYPEFRDGNPMGL